MRILTRARLCFILSGLGLLLLLTILATLFFGPTKVPISYSLLKHEFLLLLKSEPLSQMGAIWFRVRFPRTLLAGLVGGGLAMAGVGFQALLRNPLADPYILGISGGSAFFAILGMILAGSFGFVPIPIFAFLGAIIAIVLVLLVARTEGRLPVMTLLLAGVIVNAFFSALVMFILSISSIHRLPGAMYWMMGDLSVKSYSTLGAVALYYLPAILILLNQAREFNLLSLGEESAEQLGVKVEQSKLLTLLSASLLTAVAVSVSGLIGFVGLMVPHILRLALGPDHRLLLPASFLTGAAFLIICDLLSRILLAPTELPVGVITAILGGPFFIWLLHRSRERLGR